MFLASCQMVFRLAALNWKLHFVRCDVVIATEEERQRKEVGFQSNSYIHVDWLMDLRSIITFGALIKKEFVHAYRSSQNQGSACGDAP